MFTPDVSNDKKPTVLLPGTGANQACTNFRGKVYTDTDNETLKTFQTLIDLYTMLGCVPLLVSVNTHIEISTTLSNS